MSYLLNSFAFILNKLNQMWKWNQQNGKRKGFVTGATLDDFYTYLLDYKYIFMFYAACLPVPIVFPCMVLFNIVALFAHATFQYAESSLMSPGHDVKLSHAEFTKGLL